MIIINIYGYRFSLLLCFAHQITESEYLEMEISIALPKYTQGKYQRLYAGPSWIHSSFWPPQHIMAPIPQPLPRSDVITALRPCSARIPVQVTGVYSGFRG